MKRLILHIAISVALFSVTTALFLIGLGDDLARYGVEEAGESETLFTEGDGYSCSGEPVEIVEMPSRVRAGDEVFLRFKGERYTEYDIRVYYPSGRSEASVFSPRKSDGEGIFGWDFTVPHNAREGRLRITVLSEASVLMTEIEIAR